MTDEARYTRRKLLVALGGASLAAGCAVEGLPTIGVPGASGGGLTQADAAAGIRAALNNGVSHAISTIGVKDGFLLNNLIRIPLPQRLKNIQGSLSRIGLSGPLDTLETQLNRGAEAAVPQARKIFVDAISSMSISDAVGIVRGGDNAATDYLKGRTFTP
ncbi:MAG TPA: DUF4197 domain-containing protein, partial [Parvularculaceae bacterium]|nr:DUF4197 domain-containing protein [Parvularculaceae bacterium]